MSRIIRQLIFWLALYIAMVIVPLVLVLVQPLPEPRGFWVEFAIGLGFVGLAMMGVQFALTARFRWIAGLVGMDSMLHFHRQTGIIAATFVAGHIIIVILADQQYLSFFDPRVNPQRAAALSCAIVALLFTVIVPLCRQSLRISYEWWRFTHGVAAGLVILIGLAHMLMVGHYVNAAWKQGMWVLLIGASIGFLINTRLIKPWLSKRTPWRVASVTDENESVLTLALEPDGEHDVRFRPGQCMWLTLGETPYTLQQHPFTICSSAQQARRLDFTIKELGDYTRSLRDVKPGTRAFLEGPYGMFTFDPDSTAPIVMIMGGIGITPGMSMLRTLRDRGDRRPIRLLYGSVTEDQFLFREELDAMTESLNLEITYLLDKPPEGWSGESGYVDGEMLGRVVGDLLTRDDVTYFVCGPEPMMNAVERLLRERGVPLWCIASERFNIV